MLNGRSGVDVANRTRSDRYRVTSVLTKQSLANIAYGSGDIINLTTAGGSKVIAAGFTTINLGRAVLIYITSTLTAVIAKGSGATKASGLFGTTKAGSLLSGITMAMVLPMVTLLLPSITTLLAFRWSSHVVGGDDFLLLLSR